MLALTVKERVITMSFTNKKTERKLYSPKMRVVYIQPFVCVFFSSKSTILTHIHTQIYYVSTKEEFLHDSSTDSTINGNSIIK